MTCSTCGGNYGATIYINGQLSNINRAFLKISNTDGRKLRSSDVGEFVVRVFPRFMNNVGDCAECSRYDWSWLYSNPSEAATKLDERAKVIKVTKKIVTVELSFFRTDLPSKPTLEVENDKHWLTFGEYCKLFPSPAAKEEKKTDAAKEEKKTEQKQ